MSSYLQRIAKVFAHEVGTQLSDYIFVFPNKRAGLFFRKYLGKHLSHPIFAPTMMTINECFGSLSDLRVTDQLTLLVRLYDQYQTLRPTAEPIEHFLHWGKMMLADFSEIDNHLVANVEALYDAVEDMHDIDQHYHSLTDQQRNAIESFWGKYHHSVTQKQSAVQANFIRTWKLLYPLYKGLTNNLLQDKLAHEGLLHRHVIEHWDEIPLERFKKQYVFIGFNALTESERQLMLKLQERGYADFYFDYEHSTLSDCKNAASLFMKDNQALFSSRYTIPASETQERPTIKHISVSSTIGEAREVHHILEQLYATNTENKPDYTRTAVVLPDEELLIPLLDCFPEAISEINVTMGYPLRASDLYVHIAYPDKNALQSDGKSAIQYFRNQLVTHQTSTNGEALYLLTKVLDQLENILNAYPQIDFSADAVQQILLMQTKEMSIPFVGEPLNGLQVMGVLETRALDFDNIIITGFNDDLYPGRAHTNSFIPYILRRGFGLPTLERQNAIFAYNFYRMLSYAKHIWLITNSTVDEQHSGEVSRYFYQLQWQHGYQIEQEQVVNRLGALPNHADELVKTDEVLQHLDKMKEKCFSASMLNKYLFCQKQFYYKYVQGIKEPKKDEDIVITDSTLGSALHQIIQNLYQPYESKQVTSSDISSILNSLTDEKWSSLLPDKIKEDPLAVHVLRNYVQNILEYDRQKVSPFYYYAGETSVDASIDVPNVGTIKFTGTIDRIDNSNGQVRVIDYKTGSADLLYNNMQHVFDRVKNQDKALQTLLYCWMLKSQSPHFLSADSTLVPHIYAIRTLAKLQTEISTEVASKTDKKAAYTSELEDALTTELINLIQEIYDPNIAFQPTTNNKLCESCAFQSLCKR